MKLVLLIAACIWVSQAAGAWAKPVLDVAPSLAELGAGWTTNLIVDLLDPQSRSNGVALSKQKQAKGMTNVPRTTLKPSRGMGWGRFQYGHGDMIFNGGAYFVTIQRWNQTNALEKAWRRWTDRPDYSPWRGAPIGENCYWTEDAKFHGLTFKRGLFHVVVTCGSQSDHSGLFRLAEVIDAKIAGRPIPDPEPLDVRERDGEVEEPHG